MSRYLVVGSAILLFACTDQTDVSPPAQDADAASADTVSALELSLDSRAGYAAHTAAPPPSSTLPPTPSPSPHPISAG